MKINCEAGRFWTGMGDTVCLAWLYAGAKDTDTPIELYATGKKKEILNFLGVDVCDNPDGAVIPAECYQAELNEGGAKPRLEYLREYLGIKTPLKRPEHNISQTSMQWAAQQHRQLGGRIISLFPQTHWRTRAWAASYWIDLSHKLREHGWNSCLFVEGDPEEFKGSAFRFYNYKLEDVAAMMCHSWLVVGNDSMPAHLAATLGVKTLALMGPTKPECVFGHCLDAVTPLSSNKLDCVGCHFRKPFRAACDQGCMSLYSLFVDDVLKKIQELCIHDEFSRRFV